MLKTMVVSSISFPTIRRQLTLTFTTDTLPPTIFTTRVLIMILTTWFDLFDTDVLLTNMVVTMLSLNFALVPGAVSPSWVAMTTLVSVVSMFTPVKARNISWLAPTFDSCVVPLPLFSVQTCCLAAARLAKKSQSMTSIDTMTSMPGRLWNRVSP